MRPQREGARLDRVLLGLRPESVRLSSEGIAARVEAVEVLGADAYVFCSATVAGAETRLAARVEAHAAPARGESVRLVAGGGAHLFDPVSGERLGSTASVTRDAPTRAESSFRGCPTRR